MDDSGRDRSDRGSGVRRDRDLPASRREESSRGLSRPRSRDPEDEIFPPERDSRSGAPRGGTRSTFGAEPGEPVRTRRAEADQPPETRERYSDRFRRASEPVDDELDDRSSRSTRDPYDRLRRVPSRPPRRVEPEPYEDADFDEFAEDDFDYGVRGKRGGSRPSRRTTSRVGHQQLKSVGTSLTNPAPEMRPIVLGGIVAGASLLLLIIMIIVRSGSAPAWIPLHLDAEGTPISWGTKSTIWRLPIFALFASAMAFGLGWWLRFKESYAVQFLAVGTLMIHGIVWVGVITLLW